MTSVYRKSMWHKTMGVVAFTLTVLFAVTERAHAYPDGFTSEDVATNLDAVTIKAAPDGRLFLTEKKGAIRVVKNNQLLPGKFVDISAKVDATREKGLLGLAIDPEFATNNFIYGFYVDKSNVCYILRWTAAGDVAAAGSEKEIFNLDRSGQGDFHHGGDIEFGADGMLYITRGNRQDQGTSKEQTSVFGKILRINKDGTIPTDNPRYETNSGNAKAVWAWGLRNSSSIATQPGTGRMVFVDIADGTDNDEMNEMKKGAHYNAYGGGSDGPIFKKGGGGSAIMAAVFYNKKAAHHRLSFPTEYHGTVFWGQFGGSGIRMLQGTKVSSFDGGAGAVIGMDIAPDGSLWAVTRTTQVFDTKGKLIRIRYPAGEGPVDAILPGMAHARSVMRWDVRAGKAIDVELLGGGAQTLELRSLNGKTLARAESSAAGKVSFDYASAKGVHFLVWQGAAGRAVGKVVLP